jgi:hypothetical protein
VRFAWSEEWYKKAGGNSCVLAGKALPTSSSVIAVLPVRTPADLSDEDIGVPFIEVYAQTFL